MLVETPSENKIVIDVSIIMKIFVAVTLRQKNVLKLLFFQTFSILFLSYTMRDLKNSTLILFIVKFVLYNRATVAVIRGS